MTKNLPRLRSLSLYGHRVTDENVIEFLRAETIQRLPFFSLSSFQEEISAGLHDRICNLQRRTGPKILRVENVYYHAPAHRQHFVPRGLANPDHVRVRRFKEDVAAFASDLNNLLPKSVNSTLYGACEYLLEGALAGDDGTLLGFDGTMDLFIRLFPDHNVIYDLREKPAEPQRYEGRRVIVVEEGEVVSLGIDPPPDLTPILKALREHFQGNCVVVLDPTRKIDAKLLSEASQRIDIERLPEIDPSMPRRRWLVGGGTLSFDRHAASEDPQGFKLMAEDFFPVIPCLICGESYHEDYWTPEPLGS